MCATGPNPRKLVVHPMFKNFISRITDGPTLQKSFEKINYYEPNYQFTSGNYAIILPPEIPIVKQVINDLNNSREVPNIQLWFQPHLTDVVTAFLVDTDNAPLNILQTFPEENNSAEKAGRKERKNLEIYDLGIELLPLDEDVLTMNQRLAFVEGWILRDLTIVSNVRKAFDILIQKMGAYASITAIGSYATAIAKTLPSANDLNSLHLIIIDRNTDLITPCITQMNYEGLIAEYFGINCGLVSLNADSKNLMLLSSTVDPLFRSFCHLNHSELSHEIATRMQQLSGALSKKDSSENFNDMVGNFRKTAQITLENKTITDHVNIAEELYNRMTKSKYIKQSMSGEADALEGNASLHTLVTEMLEIGGDLREEARMLCLETMLKGGVPDFHKYVQQICFNHGIQQVPYLMRLCDCGMLDKPVVKWANFVKPFKLYNTEYDKTGDEAAMSYLGYAPLSIRYVENIVRKDFATVQRLVGDSFETYQSGIPQQNGAYIVFFVGGCTHSELNSLRRLAIKGPAKFSVVTTNMFSSREFFESIGFAIPGWRPIHV